jgi:hypothetical protein
MPKTHARLVPITLLLAAGMVQGCFVPGSTLGSGDGTTENAFRDRLGGTTSGSSDDSTGRSDDGRPKITLRQIDAWTNAFADRWASYIHDATTRIIDADSTPEQRRAALTLKSSSISSVYDIAVRNDPLTQLLDMVVLASLEQKVWVDEGLARATFGDKAPILTKAIEDLYSDITVTSINAMNGEQYDVLSDTIRDWREKNPDMRAVEFVRLSEFAAARAADLRQQIRSSGLFAPIDEATRVADELKELGQRGMWVGIRAPQLLSWQTEGLVDQILSRPEIAEALAGNESLVKSADRLSRTAAELPGLMKSEREAIFKGLDDREARLGSTVREVKASVEEGRKLLADTQPVLNNVDTIIKSANDLTKALTETVEAVDKVAARFAQPEPGTPAAGNRGEDFKIAEYTQAAQQLTTAVKELNTLVASAGNVVASPAWRARLDEFDALGKRQIAEARAGAVDLADVVFWRALILLGAFFVGLSAWTWLRWKLK